MNLYEDINSNLKEQTYTIKQTAGNFGTYSLCDWESTSPEKAVEEFIKQNPEFKDGKKGHITAVLKEADDKVCVLCGKHFKEWGNDPWPLANEGWCCDKCNMEKVVPARIAMASKKEEPKTEEKKEAEYGNGTRHYSEALIDLCEQGIVNWRTVAEGLINYCSEDDVEDFCRMYDFKDLIDNPTGDDSLEDSESPKEDLKESPETTNYPDWIIAELSEGNDVQAWYCPDCDTFFKEPKYVSTDMENYYGVGSDFPDHHYQDIPVCPNCNKDNLEEVYISFDSLVDDFLFNEDNYQKVYEEISNRHPEYIKSSDTLLEDIPEDVLIPVVKELMF